MYIPLSISILALAMGTAAYSGPGWAPQHRGGDHAPHPTCLNDTGVTTLVDGYTYLLEHPGGADFNSTAQSILSNTTFVVESDSILTLSGRAVRIKASWPPIAAVQILLVFCRSWKPYKMNLGNLTLTRFIHSSSANPLIHLRQSLLPHNSRRRRYPSYRHWACLRHVTRLAGGGTQVVSEAMNLRSRVSSYWTWM